MNKYVKEFHALTCYPDIMDIVMPVQKFEKELTESLAVIKHIRNIVLKKRSSRLILYDFCAGNALTSVISSFLFKNVYSVAVDKRKRDRDWWRCRNFEYLTSPHPNSDIYDDSWERKLRCVGNEKIIIGVHACSNLSKRIIDIYNKSDAEHLILMPCCVGDMPKWSIPEQIISDSSSLRSGRKYLMWALYLHSLVETENKKLVIDEHCISPKNAIIIGRKKPFSL